MTLLFRHSPFAFLIAVAIGMIPASAADAAAPSSARHVVVFYEPGRFGGWPANNGIWIWGDEILVGFELRYYKASEDKHSFDPAKPSRCLLARSLDGGKTWRVEYPENFVGVKAKDSPLQTPLRFTDSGFAMRVDGPRLFVSYDRGHNWQGPYTIAGLPEMKLTSRTDYLPSGAQDSLFFLSAAQPEVQAGGYHDRAFCARTTDGGMTFQFLSWMTGQPLTARSVMPSTARISATHLVSALRRRENGRCWIDAYESVDNGQSWNFLSKVAELDGRNGNPPSLARLSDGLLCVTYATREAPFGIRAMVSSDGGKRWGEEILLRRDGRSWDEGYTRTVARRDGSLVTVYYYSTDSRPEQHIEATIWRP
jgi:hypothetical protein